MQLSHYLKTFPFEEKTGYLLAYSTRKSSLVLISEDTLNSIEEGTLPDPEREELSRLGIIVENREDEKKSFAGVLERMNEKSPGLNITVVLNLSCNFACTYCYEEDVKGNLFMSEETAKQLIDFIKRNFTASRKWLNIDFYGGEPLMSLDIIRFISREIKSFAEGRSASFTFGLVTNGSLFRRSVAEELVQLGLSAAKITVDGPPEIHNRCRPFRSGGGSFEVVIRNIRETCDIVKIGIGGNYERDNYREFPLLFDHLEKEGLTPDRLFQVKFDPVIRRPKGDRAPVDFSEGCMSVNEPWLIAAGAFLREEVLKRGYHTPKMLPMPCQVELNNTYVVNYDGALYKCPAFLGRAKFEIGDLKNGVRDYRRSYRVGIWKDEECLECEYLPLCFGGCRYMAFVREGKIERKDCRRAFLDASIETLIRQDIRYRKQSKAH